MRLAADINLFDQGELKGFGPLGEGVVGNGPVIFNKFLTIAIGIITVIAFIWFIFLLITGAIGIMTAGGDKNALQNNSKKITNGIIGLVVLISALFIIQFFGMLFGVEDIILDPAKAIMERLNLQ